jgi:cell division protein ZapE
MLASLALPAPLRESYQARLTAGDLKPDPAQREAVEILQTFSDGLNGYAAPAPREGGALSMMGQILFGKDRPGNHFAKDWKSGLYIYGKVGRGKSMLMDLFMEHVEVAKKRRVHFHQFMLEIHARLNQLRQGDGVKDIMESLVAGIASETSLLCFDEFHVSNIADAMILGRLFSGLFDAGVVVVSTSNSAPDDLYKNGLQRDRFVPFIEMIKQEMLVFEMGGRTDYRYEQLRDLKSYFYPLGLETTRKLQGIFLDLTHDAAPEAITLYVGGRELRMSRAAHGIGFFNFDELCQTALGAADYLAIAECLHTLILDGVPVFSKQEQRNEAVRFMTLIDALYEAKVKFFMAAAAPVERLAPARDLAAGFDRTLSRLMEMQSETYRLKPHLEQGA